MKLAGEAGSLLKIEEEIKDAVAEAKRQWLEGPKPEQLLLYPERAPREPKQLEMRFDTKSITDERFWEQAEDRILDAIAGIRKTDGKRTDGPSQAVCGGRSPWVCLHRPLPQAL